MTVSFWFELLVSVWERNCAFTSSRAYKKLHAHEILNAHAYETKNIKTFSFLQAQISL